MCVSSLRVVTQGLGQKASMPPPIPRLGSEYSEAAGVKKSRDDPDTPDGQRRALRRQVVSRLRAFDRIGDPTDFSSPDRNTRTNLKCRMTKRYTPLLLRTPRHATQ